MRWDTTKPVGRTTEKRDELLLRMEAGAGRIEGGLWASAWGELIANYVSEAEAERYFSRIQALPHPTGSAAFQVRASEGRRVFAYGQANREEALHLLSTLPYHKALKAMPVLTNRGAPTDVAKAIRDQINALMEEMELANLQELQKHIEQRVRRQSQSARGRAK